MDLFYSITYEIPPGPLADNIRIVRGRADRHGPRRAPVHVAEALRDLLEGILLVAPHHAGRRLLLRPGGASEDLVVDDEVVRRARRPLDRRMLQQWELAIGSLYIYIYISEV